MTDREAAIRAAQEAATDAEKGADGVINMVHLNRALSAEGMGKATAAERDAALNATTSEPALEDADDGWTKVRITRAGADPVPVWVNGHGGFSLRVGAIETVPAEAVEALRNSDYEFEEIGQ